MKRHAFLLGGAALIAVIIGVTEFVYGGKSFNTPPPAVNDNQQQAVAVPFKPITTGIKSKVTTRTNYLITSDSELDKLWKMVDAKGSVPNVDFNNNYVAAVFAGAQPTPGYGVAVSKIEDTNVRTVIVTLIKPGAGCLAKASTTTPYVLVELPKTSLPFTHQDQASTTSCSQ